VREKAEKILDEFPIDEIQDFLDHVVELNDMLHKYSEIKSEGKDADSLMTSSIAYHLSKIVDKYFDHFTRVVPMRDYWMEINHEIFDRKISGKGKTLC
jgi:hypothetical protein